MKFDVDTEQFSKAVAVAARFVERRANLPALASILVSAEGNRLTLRATNLECGVEIVLPAKVSNGGIAAVPGGVLVGFLSNARGKNVSVTLVEELFKIETERAHASIKTTSPEDFPLLPRVSAEHSFSLKALDFVRAIRSVVMCASNSVVKPELQSVAISGGGGKLVLAATDSFRLAEKTVPLRIGAIPQLLLPARNAAELMRILETAGGEVEVYYNENQISTHIDGTYYTSRLLDGTFPNYKQIIPKEFSAETVILREDMSQALKSLVVFSDKFAHLSLAVEPAKKSILLTSRNPDVGEQTCVLQATIQGEPVALSFNSRYLADGLGPIAGDSVRLHLSGPGKPMLIKDAADNSFFYLAMPMNR